MKSAILWAFVLALVPCLALAQSRDYSEWQGYGFLGGGGKLDSYTSKGGLQIGGGGDGYFTRHLGVGVDASYMGRLGQGEWSEGWGTISANFVARFPRKDVKKVEPFVSAGYTRVNWVGGGDDDNDGFNFGAGFNWWARKRIALRIEVRDHVFFEGKQDHLLGLRIGVTFR